MLIATLLQKWAYSFFLHEKIQKCSNASILACAPCPSCSVRIKNDLCCKWYRNVSSFTSYQASKASCHWQQSAEIWCHPAWYFTKVRRLDMCLHSSLRSWLWTAANVSLHYTDQGLGGQTQHCFLVLIYKRSFKILVYMTMVYSLSVTEIK